MDRAFQPSRKYPRRPAKSGLVVRHLGHFVRVGDPENERHVGGLSPELTTRLDPMSSSASEVSAYCFRSAVCPRPAPPRQHLRNGVFRIGTDFYSAMAFAEHRSPRAARARCRTHMSRQATVFVAVFLLHMWMPIGTVEPV